MRFEARVTSVSLAGPFAEPIGARLTYLPATPMEGIDLVGTATGCRSTAHAILCSR
jgi:hypothetical protein